MDWASDSAWSQFSGDVIYRFESLYGSKMGP